MGIQFDQDIIVEILSRLPMQYLVQFKCVSKLWKTLISDPYFKMKHLNHAKNDRYSQKLLIYERSLKSGAPSMYCCPLSSVQLVEKVQKLDCPAISRSTVYCSCNGLIIIHVIDSINECSIIMLWNPSTRESVVLPDPEFSLVVGSCLGLGYDSTSGDYKILKICNGKDSSEVPGEILELKSGSWRNIDKHPRGICNKVSGMGSALAFVNDAFHWIGKSRNHFEVSRTYSLVSFSISNEVYGETPLPEEVLCLKGDFYVGVSVLDGMLCVHSTFPKCTFKLWVLKDYGVKESWNAFYRRSLHFSSHTKI
ncbi:F-box/kelch-repeat protein At3g23880-like [Lycium barbarum]|uniref:F-box/kelch-repeat protein At3g23880-like n=1 Tax=Lycium barbarum TaxID=112863 RepID=UPI00293E1AAE|nr:F-box/kelch-repeat protein At3g23880-like [Lycium barbarum]